MKKCVLTTECYLTRGDETLFMHKCKQDDMNSGKYLGVGGHFEEGESPDECMLREIEEETRWQCAKKFRRLPSKWQSQPQTGCCQRR